MMVGCAPIVNTLTDDTPSDTLVSSLLTQRAPDRDAHERKIVCPHQSEEDNKSHPARDSDSADWRSLVDRVGDNHAEQ